MRFNETGVAESLGGRCRLWSQQSNNLLFICSAWTEIALLSYWAAALKKAPSAEPTADLRLSPSDVES